MHVHIARDSVCAGDDVDPRSNSRHLSVSDDTTLEHLVMLACRGADLPFIDGGKATWCISSNVPLAVVAQQWHSPKLVHFIQPRIDELDVRNDGVWFHVSYFAQQDPDVVYDVLHYLTLRAR